MQITRELSYQEMMERLNDLQKEHETLNVTYVGQSVFGKSIPIITLGDKSAQKAVLYVSTHHACENICTSVLVRFIEDYLFAFERYAQIYGINLRYLHKMRRIYIVPMLNPDGVEYRLFGVKEDNPIRERIIGYNGGEDFSRWSANGRGVDLNHNYNADFEEYKELEKREGITGGRTKYSGEYAESEPEVSALANFIRYNIDEIEGVISLHTQGEEIYYKSGDKVPPRGEHVARLISRFTGYTLGVATGTSAYGGLTDWIIKEFNKPSFTIECGRGENPVPMTQFVDIYTKLKEILFTFPILF